MARKWGYKDVVPIIAMVAVECSDVVLSILFKAASLKGMSYFVYIAYCYVLATLVFLPLAFLSNRYFFFALSTLIKYFDRNCFSFCNISCLFMQEKIASSIEIPSYLQNLPSWVCMEVLHYVYKSVNFWVFLVIVKDYNVLMKGRKNTMIVRVLETGFQVKYVLTKV